MREITREKKQKKNPNPQLFLFTSRLEKEANSLFSTQKTFFFSSLPNWNHGSLSPCTCRDKSGGAFGQGELPECLERLHRTFSISEIFHFWFPPWLFKMGCGQRPPTTLSSNQGFETTFKAKGGTAQLVPSVSWWILRLSGEISGGFCRMEQPR